MPCNQLIVNILIRAGCFVSVFPPYFPPSDYRDKELQFNRLGSRLSVYVTGCLAVGLPISHDVSKDHF